VSDNPAAVALGDQMHAQMLDLAAAIIRNGLADEGITPNQRGQDLLDIGAAAGITAAMQVLVTLGLLPVGPR
jgi:hypothetical protein